MNSRLFAFIIKELKEMLPPTVFFAVGFNLIVVTTNLILADYLASFGGFIVATMTCPPQKIRSHDFGQSLGDLWHDCDVMPAARIFLQLIADFVVYLGLLSSGGERRSPLRISFYVGSSHCTKSAKWARGESIARRASRWLCSQSYSTGAMRSLWFNRRR